MIFFKNAQHVFVWFSFQIQKNLDLMENKINLSGYWQNNGCFLYKFVLHSFTHSNRNTLIELATLQINSHFLFDSSHFTFLEPNHPFHKNPWALLLFKIQWSFLTLFDDGEGEAGTQWRPTRYVTITCQLILMQLPKFAPRFMLKVSSYCISVIMFQ